MRVEPFASKGTRFESTEFRAGFLCLCSVYFASSHNTDFVAVLVHILGVCYLVGTLALDPAEAGYIDHILRAAIGDLRLCGRLWFGRVSWLRRWRILIPCSGLRCGSGRLFHSFLQNRLRYCFLNLLQFCCQGYLRFFRLRKGRLRGRYGGHWAWCGCFLDHRSLGRHSGPQGETGGDHCGYGNLFFMVIPSCDTNKYHTFCRIASRISRNNPAAQCLYKRLQWWQSFVILILIDTMSYQR